METIYQILTSITTYIIIALLGILGFIIRKWVDSITNTFKQILDTLEGIRNELNKMNTKIEIQDIAVNNIRENCVNHHKVVNERFSKHSDKIETLFNKITNINIKIGNTNN